MPGTLRDVLIDVQLINREVVLEVRREIVRLIHGHLELLPRRTRDDRWLESWPVSDGNDIDRQVREPLRVLLCRETSFPVLFGLHWEEVALLD